MNGSLISLKIKIGGKFSSNPGCLSYLLGVAFKVELILANSHSIRSCMVFITVAI